MDNKAVVTMSSEKDALLASRKPSDLLPQPTAEELQFLDIVYEGSVDKLVAWLQLHQVSHHRQSVTMIVDLIHLAPVGAFYFHSTVLANLLLPAMGDPGSEFGGHGPHGDRRV